MTDDIESLVNDARGVYEEAIVGKGSRLEGGDRLWGQFEAAGAAVGSGQNNSERQLRGRINELAMAKHLSDDVKIHGPIAYESDILPSGRKIDFVLERQTDSVFVEVRSVFPNTPDTVKT